MQVLDLPIYLFGIFNQEGNIKLNFEGKMKMIKISDIILSIEGDIDTDFEFTIYDIQAIYHPELEGDLLTKLPKNPVFYYALKSYDDIDLENNILTGDEVLGVSK